VQDNNIGGRIMSEAIKTEIVPEGLVAIMPGRFCSGPSNLRFSASRFFDDIWQYGATLEK